MDTNNRIILKQRQVSNLTGLHKSTIYRLIKVGQFPKQRKLSEHGKATGWFSDEVQEWIDSRPVVAE